MNEKQQPHSQSVQGQPANHIPHASQIGHGDAVRRSVSFRRVLMGWFIGLLAGVFAWVSLVVGFVAWRLTVGPIDLNWLTPHIEMSLNKDFAEKGYVYDIGRTVFTWNNGNNFVELQVRDFNIASLSGGSIAHFPKVAVTFDWTRLIYGQVALRSVTLKSPTLAVKRFADGNFSLYGVDSKPNISGELSPSETSKKHSLARVLQTLVSSKSYTKSPSLKTIRVVDARLIFVEQNRGFKWVAPVLNAAISRHENGVQIVAKSAIQLSQRQQNNTQGNTVWGPLKDKGLATITYAMEYENRTTIPNNRILTVEFDALDMRFLTQFLAPPTMALNHPDPVTGIIRMQAPQGLIPQNTMVDLQGDFGQIKGTIDYKTSDLTLDTDLDFTGINTGKMRQFLLTIMGDNKDQTAKQQTAFLPALTILDALHTQADFTVRSRGFSLVQGGTMDIALITNPGTMTAPHWFNPPLSFDGVTATAAVKVGRDTTTPTADLTLQGLKIQANTEDMSIQADYHAPQNTISANLNMMNLQTETINKFTKTKALDTLSPKVGGIGDINIRALKTSVNLDITTENFSLTKGGEFALTMTSKQGTLTLPKTFMNPIPLKDLTAKGRVHIALYLPQQGERGFPEVDTMTITQGQFSTILDTVPVRGTVIGVYPLMKGPSQTTVSVNATGITPPLWRMLTPKTAPAAVKSWLGQKIPQGTIGGTATLHFTAPSITAPQRLKTITGTLKGQNITLTDYLEPYPPLDNIDFSARFNQDAITFDITQGKVREADVDPKKTELMTLGDTTVTLGNLSGETQTLDIALQATASANDVLQMAETVLPTIELPIKPHQLQGGVTGTLRVKTPLTTGVNPTVSLQVGGTDLWLDYPDLGIRQMPLSQTDLTVQDGMITVQSKGTLNRMPLSLKWQKNLSPDTNDKQSVSDKIQVEALVSSAQYEADDVGIGDYIQGDSHITATLERFVQSGDWTINAIADLSQASVRFPQFIWGKSAGVSATLQIQGTMTPREKLILQNIQVNSQASQSLANLDDRFTHLLERKISAKPKVTTGQSQNRPFVPGHKLSPSPLVLQGEIDVNIRTGQITRALLKKLRFSDFDLSGNYQWADNTHIVTIEGKRANLEYLRTHWEMLRKGNDQLDTSAISADVRISRANFGQRGYVKDLSFVWRKSVEKTLDMRLVFQQKNASEKSTLLVSPYQRGHTFVTDIRDMGHMLNLLNIHKGIDGGIMTIKGTRITDKSPLKGTVQIDSYHLKKAPTFGRLLQAISFTSIFQALGDTGIVFDKAETNFSYQDDVLRFDDGITNNNSVGFTFSGGVNIKEQIIAIQGTAIPLYGLSRIIGVIPIIGTILTGGEGIFAANYAAEGKLSDPKITANPLSVLAPGVFRKLFPDNADETVLENKKSQ